MAVCPHAIDAYLAPLERMFEKIEAKTEEHAYALAQALSGVAEQEKSNPSTVRNKSSSRRASISISRLGQFDDLPKNAQGMPTPKRISSIALQPLFYQAQVKSESVDSFASRTADRDDNEQHAEDHQHVTQMRSIAGKQSLTKTVGGLLPRRLSRSRSGILVSPPNVVIGVSVQESTAETSEEHEGATVHASGLLHRSSETNMNKTGNGSNGWLSKAKGLTQKITGRARSKSSAGYGAS
ncbi:hypothetical protein BDN72DRAFT_671136 [Pluteus cervinus]|uniref:Uncharacterized protein n=1 Tax=Pluteus cervinus TaxID=181527 RepID=A0ACD3B9Z6_9AGAR|nr:hypothetical protein BDN72DRAFT_671136 [Pluteus cervinus]